MTPGRGAHRATASRSAARRRAPISKRGGPELARTAGCTPRTDDVEQELVGAREPLERERLLAHLEARGRPGQQVRAHGPGQEAPVQRRRDERVVLRDPQVRVACLEHFAVEVHQQRHRPRPAFELRDQEAVAPFMLAEPARQDHRGEPHRLRARLELQRAGGKLHAECAGVAWGGNQHPQPCERPGGGLVEDPRLQIGGQALLVELGHAVHEPGEVGREIDRRPVAHQHRGEHAGRGIGPVGPAGERRRERQRPPLDHACELSARRIDHRPCLDQALLELALGIRVGHHAASGAQPDALAARLERADRDVQLQPRDRARVADRSRVGLAPAWPRARRSRAWRGSWGRR